MKKFLFLTTLHFAGTLAGMADTKVRLSLKNGEEFVFSFDSRPQVTLEGDEVILTVQEKEPMTIGFAEVAMFDFPDMSGITNPDAEKPVYRLTSERLLIEGLPQNSQVDLYSSDGKLIMSRKADDSLSISRSALPKGISILNVNGKGLKIHL